MITIKTQEQFDSLCKNKVSNETVYIYPEETGEVYRLNKTLELGSNVYIKGILFPKIVHSCNSENMIEAKGTSDSNLEFIKIEGLVLDGDKKAKDGIHIEYCGKDSSGVVVKRCTIQNVKDDSIDINSSLNCMVIYNTCSRIYLCKSSNNTVTSNICNNNNIGIHLTSSSNNTITSNICNNNASDGIYLGSSSSNNTITSNICNNNSDGIYLANSSSNNTITSNTCNNNSSSGIYLGSSSTSIILNNICQDNKNNANIQSSKNSSPGDYNIF